MWPLRRARGPAPAERRSGERGARAQVAAGPAAVVHDLSTGRVVRRYVSCARAALHSPRVEGTRDGRTLFCGDAEGAVLAYDLRRAPAPRARLAAAAVQAVIGWEAGP